MHTALELTLTSNDFTLCDKEPHCVGVEVSMHRVHQYCDQRVLVGVNHVGSTQSCTFACCSVLHAHSPRQLVIMTSSRPSLFISQLVEFGHRLAPKGDSSTRVTDDKHLIFSVG